MKNSIRSKDYAIILCSSFYTYYSIIVTISSIASVLIFQLLVLSVILSLSSWPIMATFIFYENPMSVIEVYRSFPVPLKLLEFPFFSTLFNSFPKEAV